MIPAPYLERKQICMVGIDQAIILSVNYDRTWTKK